MMVFAVGFRSMRVWYLPLGGFVCLVLLLVMSYSKLKADITNLEAQVRGRNNIGGGGGGGGPAGAATTGKWTNIEKHRSRTTGEEMDEEDDVVIIYNRVPKTASTTFMGLAYTLCETNNYHVIHVNISKNSHVMSMADQSRFAHNVTEWIEMKPAIYHGHFAFVDFFKFGVKSNPVYINILRKPLDRLVSYYYFLRYGDDFRPYLVRSRAGDKMTFDQCVENEEADCAVENMWLQIPFFCGHLADCRIPGNSWALEMAKQNLIQKYMLVGLTEELEAFVAILESTLPRFFKGATKLYHSGNKSHLRKTATKFDPLPETVKKIQESVIWKMENEFYEFAAEQFHFLRKTSLATKNGLISDVGQKVIYEKIRPK